MQGGEQKLTTKWARAETHAGRARDLQAWMSGSRNIFKKKKATVAAISLTALAQMKLRAAVSFPTGFNGAGVPGGG